MIDERERERVVGGREGGKFIFYNLISEGTLKIPSHLPYFISYADQTWCSVGGNYTPPKGWILRGGAPFLLPK